MSDVLGTADLSAIYRELLQLHSDNWTVHLLVEYLRRAVNAACLCGGRGPGDHPCPACAVWHGVIKQTQQAMAECDHFEMPEPRR